MFAVHCPFDDWMVTTGEAMCGGYTVRAVLKDMPKERAEKYRATFRD